MSLNDLKIDIIATVSGLSDTSLLEKIRGILSKENSRLGDHAQNWDIPTTEIRKGVSFPQLMEEQRYQPITYEEFSSSDEEWTVSLDELLAHASASTLKF